MGRAGDARATTWVLGMPMEASEWNCYIALGSTLAWRLSVTTGWHVTVTSKYLPYEQSWTSGTTLGPQWETLIMATSRRLLRDGRVRVCWLVSGSVGGGKATSLLLWEELCYPWMVLMMCMCHEILTEQHCKSGGQEGVRGSEGL